MKTAFWMVLLSFLLAQALSLATVAHAGEPGAAPVNPGQLNLSVPFEPIQKLFEEVKTSFDLPALRSRGEAHITVLTPPEFQRVFASQFTAQEVMDIMRQEGLEQSHYDTVCLGHVSAEIRGQEQKAFFVLGQLTGPPPHPPSVAHDRLASPHGRCAGIRPLRFPSPHHCRLHAT